MTDQKDTETIDRLYLELSQFTQAKTHREIALEQELEVARHERDMLHDSVMKLRTEVYVLRRASDRPAWLQRWAIRPGGWWKHLKRGSEYASYGICNVQAARPIQEGEQVVLYGHPAKDGTMVLYIRPQLEFMDGRFKPLHWAPSPEFGGPTEEEES
jgi:hypothetical protein